MIGGILIKLAFLACFLSVAGYYHVHRRGDLKVLRFARACYHATVGGVMLTAALLLYFILTHQFQYTYVWSYSSVDLPAPLLISTFYAGQEGSFLLWSLYTALMGVVLLHYSSRRGYEPQVMAVYGLIQLMLLLLLIVKNPFTYVWETFPHDVQAGFVPANGRGLNPLLQNYWMVIHPQVLFSGFASMSVPYAYAIAALMKRDYDNWIRPAVPWLAFGALVLGTGIIMGGFWAYETLGWGGYWAWDPVENSSLVPWLVAVGSLHTMTSQRKSGAFVRMNLVLSMLCFVLVLYSTFLTRSGVLGDTSVHSFVDPGMWAYWLLIGVMVLFAGLGAILLMFRLKEMPKVPVKHSIWSREFALFLGSATLVCMALFVVVGTSSPLITGIVSGKTTAVDISYYSTTTMPLGIAIGILAGVGQLLWWTRSEKRVVLQSLALPFVLAALLAVSLALLGVASPLVALFVFGALFALFANLQVLARLFKGNPKYAAGSVAHIGMALMFLGFVTSAGYDSKQTLTLTEGEPVDALGYTLTYGGYFPLGGEKYAFRVQVEKDGRKRTVTPVMYYSEYTQGLMRTPDILNLITKDFYLAPLSLEDATSRAEASKTRAQISKGETVKMGDLEVTFLEFDLSSATREAMLRGEEGEIGVKLAVKEYGKQAETVIPAKVVGKGEASDRPARYGNRFQFTVENMRVENGSTEKPVVEIGVLDLSSGQNPSSQQRKDFLVVEASVKPGINLVWAGVIVLLVGFAVTIVRRVGEAARAS
jgi:cytochrome c-type biogenesis protein CcmF